MLQSEKLDIIISCQKNLEQSEPPLDCCHGGRKIWQQAAEGGVASTGCATALNCLLKLQTGGEQPIHIRIVGDTELQENRRKTKTRKMERREGREGRNKIGKCSANPKGEAYFPAE